MLKEHLNGYALALLSLAQEDQKLKPVKEDAKKILEAIKDGNEAIINILASKSLYAEDVEKITSSSLSGINKNLVNFINLVSLKSKAAYIIPTLQKLIQLINNVLNIKEGIVYTTIPLTASQLHKMENKVDAILGYKPELKNKIDKNLISGFKIKIRDEIIEDSVISRIHNIKYKLLKGDR